MSIPINHHLMLVAAINAAEGIGRNEDDSKPAAQWETPVTVIVHGVIIVGVIISREKYMTMVIDSMKAGKLSNESDANRLIWETINDTFKEVALQGETSGNYLYLANAHVLNMTRVPAIRNCPICVRVADISAFMMGHPAE